MRGHQLRERSVHHGLDLHVEARDHLLDQDELLVILLPKERVIAVRYSEKLIDYREHASEMSAGARLQGSGQLHLGEWLCAPLGYISRGLGANTASTPTAFSFSTSASSVRG